MLVELLPKAVLDDDAVPKFNDDTVAVEGELTYDTLRVSIRKSLGNGNLTIAGSV